MQTPHQYDESISALESLKSVCRFLLAMLEVALNGHGLLKTLVAAPRTPGTGRQNVVLPRMSQPSL